MTRPTLLVTGGAGFIGSALCRYLVASGAWRVANLDKLTYAASTASLAGVEASPLYRFIHADVGDARAVTQALRGESPDAILHLAAETHVDRSIDGPAPFVETNVVGTACLLEAALEHWKGLPPGRRDAFRFVHVSTDEVFGDLPFDAAPFDARSPYRPSSPYAASKAASDHLARAWHRTYGLPVVVSSCSNNYGPWQHPEKLIPLAILNALEERPIPVYGRGEARRDWLFVEDHVRALEAVLQRGAPGETYVVGGRCERSTLEVVRAVCAILDRLRPRPAGAYAELIRFVPDRPGHDLRYAVNPSRTEAELGWRATKGFEAGLEATVAWYLSHEPWWRPLRSAAGAAKRLGLARALSPGEACPGS